MDFCSAHSERQWALIVRTFQFWLGSPWLKKPSSCCCTNSMLAFSQIWQPQVEKSDANAICIQLSKSDMCAHFLFVPSRDFSSRWEIITRHVKGHSDYSPPITAHNWTVSDHQWSKALKLRIGFTLRMWNCVSSSWFERLRISDRKFVVHTTEMILYA